MPEMIDEAPAVLLDYQQESLDIADEHQFAVYEKSRRIGLSYAFAPYADLKASAARSPQNVYYIGYNLDMAREFIGYCAEFAQAFEGVRVSLPDDVSNMVVRRDDGSYLNIGGNVMPDAKDGDFADGAVVQEAVGGFLIKGDAGKSVKAFRIDFPSGKAVIALPSSPRSVRGKQGIFIIDEAAFHDNLEELIKAILAALVWGGSVIVISTHDGTDNFFNTLIEEIRAEKRAGNVHRITFEDAIDAGLYKRICLVQGKNWSPEAEAKWEADIRKTYGDAAEEELDVVPARGSGTYLARATILEAMSKELPVVRLRCPDGFERWSEERRRDWLREYLDEEVKPWLGNFDPNRRTFMGQDFARSGDVSPVKFGQHDEHMRLVCRLTLEMRNVPFSDQEFIIEWLIRRVPHFAGGKMDGRGNGSALAEKMQQLFGFDVIESVMATDKVYLQYMPLLKAGIEDRTFIIPHDEGELDDLRMIKQVRGIPKIPDRPANSRENGKVAKRHGDNAIADMHLIAAANEDPGDIEFLSAGGRDSGGGDFGFSDRGFGTVSRRNSGGFGL
jgi:phage FluMu gp28-like protein